MRLEFGEYLSRIMVKARKKYRFFGVVFGRFGIGVIWPSAKAPVESKDNQPELPGIMA